MMAAVLDGHVGDRRLGLSDALWDRLRFLLPFESPTLRKWRLGLWIGSI